MNSESESEEDGEMDFQGIVCKYLLRYLHGKTKKLSQTVFDTYSKVYDDSIRELLDKYPNLEEAHIYYFLDTPSVEESINSYFENPDQKIFFNKLVEEFINCFDMDHFSRKEAEEIIKDLFQILENNIRKNPDLKSNLIFQILKENQIHLKSFLTIDELFSRSLKSTNLLNHKYHFVGRSDILSQLDSFLESDKKIALLPGKGGIGKSRILFEFGKIFESKHDEWEPRYVSENPLTRDSIRELPNRKCVIVVDDAHRREDIITLLETAQQADVIIKSPIKIILAFRPHGLNYIKSNCNRCGFDTRKIEEISEVGELKRKEKEELGKSILGPKHHQYLEPLIKVAKDSTIVLVIGAQLIAEDKVQPAFLAQDQEFQETVFRRFKEDIISGFISEDLDATFCRDLLSTISILSPIQKENELIERLAKYLGIKRSKLNRAIDTLERGGILHRVGSKLRITPDVLSDHILHSSCITLDGYSTGYSQEIFEDFGDVYLDNILNNLSELDWRVTRQREETDILVEVWHNIVEKFKNSSNWERSDLLDKLEKVAYFQPKRTLELIEYAIRNPIKASKQDEFYQYTHENVINKIPSLLEKIAYSYEHLPRCCELLWYLEINNRKQENFYPHSKMTMLTNLAKYEMYKPFEYNALVLDFVEKCIGCSDDPIDTYFLLNIIDSLLKKEGESSRRVGYEVRITSFSIPYHRTKAIRKKAIFLISDCLKSESPSIVLRALKSLTEALRPPLGLCQRNVSDEEINSWLPEQLEILNLIEGTAKNTKYPIVKIQIQSSLEWHAKHSRQVEIKEKANSIIGSISNTFEIRFARAIGNHYDADYGNYENHQEQIKKEMGSVAKEFLIRCDSKGKKAFETLKETISQFEDCKVEVQPGNFLHIISVVNYEVAIEICKYILSDTSTNLKKYINALLSGIREKDPEKAIKLINDAIDSEDIALYQSVACGYAYQGWAHNIEKEEIEIIKQLLDFEDEDTKKFAIESLRGMSRALMTDAFDLALTVQIGNNERLADVYCSVFNSKYGIPLESLDNEQLKLILKKISKIKVLESNLYNLNIFLTYCSTKIPEELVDFLLERVDLSKSVEYGSDDRFQPIPHIGFFDNGLNGISLSPHYKKILRKVRDRSLSPDWQDSFWLPKLYSYISENFSLASLEVLNEWVNIGDEEKINAVGLLVKEASSDFVFSHSDFVSNVLTNAQEISDDCYKKVRSNISDSVLYGCRSGTAGQPSPQDENLRDKAQELMGKYQPGSTTWNFYNYLCEKGKMSIKNWLERDEEMMED